MVMAAKPTIIKCPSCGTRNRVRPTAEGTPRCSVCHTVLPWIVETDAAGFDEEITASVPVLVDFGAPWCGPCRMVSPVVEQMGRDYAGRLKVVKLDIDQAPAIAARYGVQGIPLLVVFKDGREADRVVGAVPAGQLREVLERHVASATGAATAGST
ncbi:MAG: thioredoxin 2 [Solirubrobacteraceae bacterium]|nr:thioredoxin 2 [Solirubrobacteraceae bacterium]